MTLFGKKEPEQAQAGGAGNSNGHPGARGYGIDQAVALMRTLPVDQNVELVVRVIRSTLESLNVQLPAIIDDALAKEATLQGRMEKLDREIEDFAEQIDLRRHEIGRLSAELKETSTVKDRLLLAQKLGTPVSADEPTAISVLHAGNGLPPPLKLPVSMKAAPDLRAAAAK
jgi:hypothetical protein